MEAKTLFNKNIAALQVKNPKLAESVVTAAEQESCYIEKTEAKNGMQVARFKSGKTMFSTYNPQRDADFFAAACTEHADGFFAVTGLGNALHIKKAHEICGNSFFLIIEKNAASVQSLFEQFDFSELIQQKRFQLCIPEQLDELLPLLYIPALYSGFFHEPLRVWAQENYDVQEQITKKIQHILDKISADFSVQAHFGKIWMRNILRNLRTASVLPQKEISFPTEKTAAIIGAGSTLDLSVNELHTNRDNLYIVSTDTGLQALASYGIIADAVVSIDGQNISYQHFFNGMNSNTLLAADLCAHPKAAENAIECGSSVLFFQGAHPLCLLANHFQLKENESKSFMQLDCSAGTVTAAAIDFAVHVGFTNIQLHGADFLYLQKPYARGTYLDAFYAVHSNRFMPIEQEFVSLMLRTETTRVNGGYATKTLSSYAASVSKYARSIHSKQITISRAINRGYPLDLPINTQKTTFPRSANATIKTLFRYPFPFTDFVRWYAAELENKNTIEIETSVTLSILPLLAWTTRAKNFDQSKNRFFYAKNLAKYLLSLYNKNNDQ